MSAAGTPYTCALCGLTFLRDRDEAEALAECRDLFGEPAEGEPWEILCHDCWERVCPGGKPDPRFWPPEGGEVPR